MSVLRVGAQFFGVLVETGARLSHTGGLLGLKTPHKDRGVAVPRRADTPSCRHAERARPRDRPGERRREAPSPHSSTRPCRARPYREFRTVRGREGARPRDGHLRRCRSLFPRRAGSARAPPISRALADPPPQKSVTSIDGRLRSCASPGPPAIRGRPEPTEVATVGIPRWGCIEVSGPIAPRRAARPRSRMTRAGGPFPRAAAPHGHRGVVNRFEVPVTASLMVAFAAAGRSRGRVVLRSPWPAASRPGAEPHCHCDDGHEVEDDRCVESVVADPPAPDPQLDPETPDCGPHGTLERGTCQCAPGHTHTGRGPAQTCAPIPECRGPNDGHEPNDDPSSATPRADVSGDLYACPAEADWFTFSVEAGNRVDVELRFDGAEVDLDLFLFGPSSPDPRARAVESSGDFERAGFVASGPGAFTQPNPPGRGPPWSSGSAPRDRPRRS